MKSISGKEISKILEKKGWELKRINGSHHIYAKEGFIERISVPIHGNKSLKTGLQKFIMTTAGISENEL